MDRDFRIQVGLFSFSLFVFSAYENGGAHLTSEPMTRDEVIAKSRDLIAPVLGEAASTRLIDKVLSIEKVKDIRELQPLLQLV
jgi:hypothetical protein